MANVVGMGVVGAGAIGLRGALSHLTLPDVQDRVRVVAVCDPVPGLRRGSRPEVRRAGRVSILRGAAGRSERGCGDDLHAHRAALRPGDGGDCGWQAHPLQQDDDHHGGRSRPADGVRRGARGAHRRLAGADATSAQPAHPQTHPRGRAGPAGVVHHRHGRRGRIPHARGVSHRPGHPDRRESGLVLQEAGRRPAVRRDGLLPAYPHRHPGAGETRIGAFGHGDRRTGVSRREDRLRYRRQHHADARFRRCVFRLRLRGAAGRITEGFQPNIYGVKGAIVGTKFGEKR